MGNRMQFDLSGRTVLVTGASSGLGARFAKILAKSGANVVIAARRKEKLDALKDEIERDGAKVLSVAMDVSDDQSVIAGYDAAEAAFGTVDTIIANAGTAVEENTLEMPVEHFDRVMSVNLRGVFLTAREGAKRLIAAGSKEKENGRVIIISSITAKKIFRGLTTYGTSKAAVTHMARSMASEWARKGINVNTILPGYINTEMTGSLWETPAGKALISSFPRNRLTDESDLDGAILFLSSDASKGVTGAEIVVDDGQTL